MVLYLWCQSSSCSCGFILDLGHAVCLGYIVAVLVLHRSYLGVGRHICVGLYILILLSTLPTRTSCTWWCRYPGWHCQQCEWTEVTRCRAVVKSFWHHGRQTGHKSHCVSTSFSTWPSHWRCWVSSFQKWCVLFVGEFFLSLNRRCHHLNPHQFCWTTKVCAFTVDASWAVKGLPVHTEGRNLST